MSRVMLAIDPGSELTAYVVWNGASIEDKGKVPNKVMLSVMTSFALNHPGGECVIEQIAHYGTGMPAGRTVFDTCIWIGRYVQTWADLNRNQEPRLIERRKVKMHLCGSARAKDGNIRQALIDRYGEPGTKKEPGKLYGVSADVWQALGLAVTAWETSE